MVSSEWGTCAAQRPQALPALRLVSQVLCPLPPRPGLCVVDVICNEVLAKYYEMNDTEQQKTPISFLSRVVSSRGSWLRFLGTGNPKRPGI